MTTGPESETTAELCHANAARGRQVDDGRTAECFDAAKQMTEPCFRNEAHCMPEP